MRAQTQTKRSFILGLAGFMIATLILPMVNAIPASASAWGCSYFGNFTIAGLPTPIYKGNYCVDLNGSGTSVNYVAGYFSSAGNICNWNITAEFFDAYNKWYKTYSSPIKYSCDRIANKTISIGERMKKGYMCSTLKTNSKRITSVCHNIF